MKPPSSKKLDKFRPIYDYYLRNGDMPSRAHYKAMEGIGVKIVFNADGPRAIEAAWILETYGKKVIGLTSQPDLLAKFYDGKGWHGVNVKNWVEGFLDGTLLLGEFSIYNDIPDCFYYEICKDVQDKMEEKDMYCPSCYSFSRDKMRELWEDFQSGRIVSQMLVKEGA